MAKHDVFVEELKTIESEDIREFAEAILDAAPEYFYHVPASSTGKYHPEYSLGEGGLVRHTKAVVRFYNHITNIEQNKSLFTERELDLGRVACLAHDLLKSGTEESYNKQIENGKEVVYTEFLHPLFAANFVLQQQIHSQINEDEAKFIAKSIMSHMGEFNTSKKSNCVLPKPVSDMQKIIHLADYLASRKDLIVSF